MAFFRLVRRNLLRHPLRSLLTVASLTVALFLVCLLRSLVTTLESGTEAANPNRMIVQSAVSLFVDLPLSYQPRIAAVPGVEATCKWQWFGGYYRERSNQFAQFAVDPETLVDFFPREMEIVEGSREAWEQNRVGALIGEGLAERFDFEVGDRVPLIGDLFPHPDGHTVPWIFEVEAIYRPLVNNFDSQGFFFHWDYFEKTIEQGGRSPGVGTFYVRVTPGTEPTAVMAAIDGLFEHGPQRVQTTSEAEFQAQFISMFGNVPFFLAAIGGGVLAAILLACINTMLMAAREQTRDIGILKALGFSDASMGSLLVAQALFLCGLGGGLGVALAVLAEDGIAAAMGPFFPGFAVTAGTVALGLALTLLIGLFSGVAPAWRTSRMRCVEALGSRE